MLKLSAIVLSGIIYSLQYFLNQKRLEIEAFLNNK